MRLRRKIVRDSRIKQIKQALSALTLDTQHTNEFAHALARLFVNNTLQRLERQRVRRSSAEYIERREERRRIARNKRLIVKLQSQLKAVA